eukprot:PhM_4_TR7523/c0_g1_i1/m.81046
MGNCFGGASAECPNCTLITTKDKLELHKRVCPKRVVLCPECDVPVQFDSLDAHQSVMHERRRSHAALYEGHDTSCYASYQDLVGMGGSNESGGQLGLSRNTSSVGLYQQQQKPSLRKKEGRSQHTNFHEDEILHLGALASSAYDHLDNATEDDRYHEDQVRRLRSPNAIDYGLVDAVRMLGGGDEVAFFDGNDSGAPVTSSAFMQEMCSSKGLVREAPGRVVLVMDAHGEEETIILSDVLSLRLARHVRRRGITSIVFDLPSLMSVPDNFLAACPKLKSVRWSSPCGGAGVSTSSAHFATAIGDNFLALCTKLVSVEGTQYLLAGLTAVPKNFLRGCESLQEVNIRALARIQTVGSGFLEGCRALSRVDLAPLARVHSLDGSFLRGCHALLEVDLAPLEKVAVLGPCFLEDCRRLTRVTNLNLPHVVHIPRNFLANARSLVAIDLQWVGSAPSSEVESIEPGFLANCRSLRAVELPHCSRRNFKSIPDGFLAGCSALPSLDLEVFAGVTSVGVGFLSECTSLTSLDLTPLRGMTHIPAYFLHRCVSLPSDFPQTMKKTLLNVKSQDTQEDHFDQVMASAFGK